MTDLITLLIFALVGILMVAGGAYLVYDWNKRINAWDSPPNTSEYFGCLAQGWVGAMAAVLGAILLFLSAFVAIFC